MTNKSRRYITTLTPLRGIAAILVVVFHSNLMLETFIPPGITGIVEEGWLWVDFFFILSGFIMMYVYGESFQTSIKWSGFIKYTGARFARVYPLNFITMLIALALAVYIRHIADGLDPFFDSMLNPWAAPASALFLQGMHLFDAAPLNTPSWSLSTEWWMYMIFPVLVPVFSNLKNRGKLILLSCIILGYYIVIYVISPMTMNFNGNFTLNLVADFGFFRCAVGFMLGMWLHEIYKAKSGFKIFKKDTLFLISFLGIIMGMHFHIHSMFIIVLFCLTILTAAYNDGFMKRILDTKPLQLLGDWSFSIYMVHVLIIYVFWIIEIRNDPKLFSDFMALITREPDYSKGIIRLLILLPSTLILAAFTYKFIEIPSRNFLRNKFNRENKNLINLEDLNVAPKSSKNP